MRRDRGADGYALLATLVIVALTGLFSAACVAAVTARQSVTTDDGAGQRVRFRLHEGLDAVCERLRWSPLVPADQIEGRAAAATDGSWSATWSPAPDAQADGYVTLRVDVRAKDGAARGNLQAMVELRQEDRTGGVVVVGDMEIHSAMTIAGAGVYCGDSVRGREHLSFVDESVGEKSWTTDGVQTDLWPLAAAHAAEQVWGMGVEIHEASELRSDWSMDTDRHTLDTRAAAIARPMEAARLCALREHAVSAGEAFSGGVLDLSLLPREVPAQGSNGCIVFIRPEEAEGPLRIIGQRPATACALTLVVEGDASLGAPEGAETRLAGAVVVTGTLDVVGPLRLEGHLHAGRMRVHNRCSVRVPQDWRHYTSPGLSEPVIVALAGV